MLTRIAYLFFLLSSAIQTSLVAATMSSATLVDTPTTNGHLTQDELRLSRVGYRLATANANRCEKPEMMTGLILHDPSAYAEKYRYVAKTVYDLTYGFGVRNVIPNSAAAHADIREGDEIVALNGEDLKNFGMKLITSRASYDRTEKFVDLLNTALHNGPAQVRVRRAGTMTSLVLSGDAGCGGRLVLMPERSLNAWSDGKYVALTSKMVSFARDDDELAFVVAHEMAHNILGHEATKGASSLWTKFGIGTKEIKTTELDADAYAVQLMASADYDPSAAERLLRHVAQVSWLDIPTTHPGATRRIAVVATAIATLDKQ